MNWTDFAGAELLKRVFAQPLPIEKVDLFAIRVDRNGPAICIEFDLVNQLPDTPVPKWTTSKFNRCRLGINCGGVEELMITGWQTKNIVDVDIKRTSQHKNFVRFYNENLQIAFLCADLVVTGPSVYLDAGTQ